MKVKILRFPEFYFQIYFIGRATRCHVRVRRKSDPGGGKFVIMNGQVRLTQLSLRLIYIVKFMQHHALNKNPGSHSIDMIYNHVSLSLCCDKRCKLTIAVKIYFL